VLVFEARPGGYVSHGRGYAFALASGGAVLHIGGHRVRMAVAGANPRSSLQALDPMPGKANYFFGATRASYDLYGRVRLRGVYPGVDVEFHGSQEYLEYDFLIAARRDPRKIQLAFDGIDGIRIDASGDLVLRAGAIEIRQPKPFAYQIVAGKKQPVGAAYWIDASNRVRFRTGAYDRNRALVIDPEIVFEQTFGGSGVTVAAGLASDSQGNLYVTGSTGSVNFPTVNPLQGQLDSAPLIVSSNGGASWSDVLVGTASVVNFIAAAPSAPLVTYAVAADGIFSSADGGFTWTATAGAGLPAPATNPLALTALAVDAQSPTTLYAATTQGPYVSTDGAATWQSISSGLPGLNVAAIAAHPTQAGTVFVAVPPSPALFRSTNFGQTWTQLPTPAPSIPNSLILDIAIGSNGTIVAASSNGPIIISADNGNTWTTGANQGATNKQALAISPANPGTVYLAVNTGVLKSSDGGQTFTSVLSVPAPEDLNQVAVDPTNPSTVYATTYGSVYRSTNAGQTWSQLTTPYSIAVSTLFVSPANGAVFVGSGIESDVFVTKWTPDGSQMLYSTYFGGAGSTMGSGIAVDAAGNAYLTGATSSPGFPTTPGAFQTKLATSQDVFVAKLNAAGSQIVYSTLLGSQSAYVSSIAVDGSGEAVIAGSTGVSVPTTTNALQIPPIGSCPVVPGALAGFTYNGAAFVTKFAASGSSLVFSTMLAGSCATYGNQIALDANGNAWVVGSTISPDFPVTKDALQPKYGGGTYDGDGYLASFSPSGTLTYATYIGGPGYDTINALAFDSSGNIYLTGESAGLSQPASAGAYQATASASCPPNLFISPNMYQPQGNGVVMKLDPTAQKVEGLTYLGAPGCLDPTSIAVDSSGEPWIAAFGGTPNNTLPIVNPVEVGGPGFISKFSADFTQLLLSTQFDSVVGLAINTQGMAYAAGNGNATETRSAYLAEVDSTPQAITIQSIMSLDASKNPATAGAIAPGELLQITGSNLGPTTPTPGIVNAGVLATSVAGVTVTFDGVAVPLLAVSAQQIELMTPFELSGKSTTTIQVQYNGGKSNAVQVPVTATELQILGVFNDDFTPNSAANPAAAGSLMSLYVGGVGNANPPSQDGQVNAPPFAPLALPVQLLWLLPDQASETLALTFANSAPATVAGIFQINFAGPPASGSASLLQVLGPNLFTGGGSFQIYVKQ
jgi:uncharacterized protein (TIGR03437 family)